MGTVNVGKVRLAWNHFRKPQRSIASKEGGNRHQLQRIILRHYVDVEWQGYLRTAGPIGVAEGLQAPPWHRHDDWPWITFLLNIET